MNELALFAGAGGSALGGNLLGWRTVCAVEINAFAASVLAQRQNDGMLPIFPIWSDVRTFDGSRWRGTVEVISGGFPCQDISIAGKGAGINGERSGLWSEFARIIREVGPRFVFVENSPALTSRGLDRVLGDLASMGFDARWGCVSAADAIWLGGTPCLDHERLRIWIAAKNADSISERCNERGNADAEYDRSQLGSGGKQFGEISVSAGNGRSKRGRLSNSHDATQSHRGNSESARVRAGSSASTDTQEQGRQGPVPTWDTRPERCAAEYGPWRRNGDWWLTEPELGRVAYGVANRVDRLAAIGNGQVPGVAALAWRMLTEDWID